MITSVDINVNAYFTWKSKQSEVGVVIIENNRKLFLLIYRAPLIYGGPIHKDLGKLEDTSSADKLLS